MKNKAGKSKSKSKAVTKRSVKPTSPGLSAAYGIAKRSTPNSKFTDEQRLPLIAELRDRIAEGESVRDIIKSWRKVDPKHEYYPQSRMVRTWVLLGHKPGASEIEQRFTAMYRDAQALRAETIHDEIYEIADEPCETSVDATRNKTRIWARMWSLGKLAPKTYGDKIQQEHTVQASPVSEALIKITEVYMRKHE